MCVDGRAVGQAPELWVTWLGPVGQCLGLWVVGVGAVGQVPRVRVVVGG